MIQRHDDNFSHHLTDTFLDWRLWLFGAAHRITMHIAMNIAKLP
jgi:hypothetical protein